MKKFSTWIIAIAVATLTACGGGGGGGSAPTVSTSDYQLRQAWVNYVTQSGTKNFTLSGTANGGPVSGSGTVTRGPLIASTFESQPAQAKSTIVTGSLNVSGQTFPYGSNGVSYVDSNYLPLGVAAQEYIVVVGAPVIPQTAKINDTGSFYTATRYQSSQKSYSLGTVTVSYVLQPDTANTALLKVITTEKTTSGVTESTGINTYRMTPAGELTPLKEEYQQGSTALTLNY